ncbi:hypothetical protein BCR44DRAFT_1422260 [Catenaria anguillulae PL171]|uniref:Protein kinase domain-containing protein n=1 Tax=Catenaria anguillulae PL171 TaxID=765915 RepID=A0A1Y2I2R7_9FUNG|nr:hypothetical protein BCR44DRAFT_1422260 [Catenaria anguillulae PL171]
MHANHHPLLSRLCAEVPSVDPELLDLVAQCLTWDPEARVTAQKVLQHPFVKKWARRAVV